MSNLFRPTYRALSPDESAYVADVKAYAQALADLIDTQIASRHTALALTKLEECVMWAVKGATGEAKA
jgi:hypothetical protein